ncbi:uncharacterized protein LOC121773661 [Salvia splendens]|uniref:uncharacterized protein LOC121773661 n=1 Tax=Salvia splendens TaxID=180675 RepID=UPI001C256547|nr:uncharacterized protein LOC121773661 [Salvia splendens]
MWTRHHTFQQEVARIWETEVDACGMRKLQLKLALAKGALKVWNKVVFGNIFEKVREAGDRASLAQAEFERDPSPANRSIHNQRGAEYLLTLKMEEDFWKQKAAVRWIVEGERNTRYFQGRAKQRKIRARIHEVSDNSRQITGDEELRSSTASFFKQLLTSEDIPLHEPNLDLIQPLPINCEVGRIEESPLEPEVKQAVFDIAADGTPGPDGFSSLFFQTCWDIVGKDVTEAIQDFFGGGTMPRSFTSTMIVLIPKKEKPVTWSDYRPISLCNITNKIISKILATRLGPFLPLVTSPNQSGFIKGRLLSDNVLLAQELIHNLGNCSPTPNLALKLDMTKAYDRVQWSFLLRILTRMGFPARWIDMVDRCVNNCWFSVLINGAPAGFFKSTRGLRQGDPLSPALFILAAEYLSRTLDKLILGRREMAFITTRHAPQISHLAYADDLIVFTQAKETSLRQLVQTLGLYEKVSGQMINAEKSHFFLDEKHTAWAPRIKRIGGFQQGKLPFIYLGVPIFKGIKKNDMFLFLWNKISERIHSWSHRFLSFGGRLTLIKSTLGAIPLHIFQVLEPTKEVIKKLESLMARFFWGATGEGRKTHWINWDLICHPYDEGGLGIRKLQEMTDAFSMKLWWRLREQGSLWAKFMMLKYCSKAAPSKVKYTGRNSPTWKRILKAGAKAHHLIKWSLGDGEINVWEDIWFGDQPLSSHCNPFAILPLMKVNKFWCGAQWNMGMLQGILGPLGVPRELIEAIKDIPIEEGMQDRMRWSLTPRGNFSVTSAWELCRHHHPHTPVFGLIWNKHLLPSMSISIWRLLANRIPVDEKLQWRDVSIASKCRCCKKPQTESRQHLFLNGDRARKIWLKFARWFPNAPRIDFGSTNFERRIRTWSRNLVQPAKDHVSIIISCVILWFLWIERNNHIHNETTFSVAQIEHRVVLHLQHATRAGTLSRKQWAGCSPAIDIPLKLPSLQSENRPRPVLWVRPQPTWIKLNTDGTFLPATESAGGGGILRDDQGEIIKGFHQPLQAFSSMEAELLALAQGLEMAREVGRNIWIELDAKVVVDNIIGGNLGAATNRHVMARIRNDLQKFEWKISHIHREGNKVADKLASMGCQEQSRVTFSRNSAPPSCQSVSANGLAGNPILPPPPPLNFSFSSD